MKSSFGLTPDHPSGSASDAFIKRHIEENFDAPADWPKGVQYELPNNPSPYLDANLQPCFLQWFCPLSFALPLLRLDCPASQLWTSPCSTASLARRSLERSYLLCESSFSRISEEIDRVHSYSSLQSFRYNLSADTHLLSQVQKRPSLNPNSSMSMLLPLISDCSPGC